LFVLTGCQSTKSDQLGETKPPHLNGVYQLLAAQPQNEAVFKSMKDVDIIKIFTDDSWISVAYLKATRRVVSSQGGIYTYADGKMRETIQYHSKDTNSIGITTTYHVGLAGNVLHQCGIFKSGTPDAWKVEEYWIKSGE